MQSGPTGICIMNLLHVRVADRPANKVQALLKDCVGTPFVFVALSNASLRHQPFAGLDPNMRLGSFLNMLEKESGLRAEEIEIMTGYPPAPLKVPHDPDSLLSCLAISSGDTLLIRRQENTSAASPVPSAVTSDLAANNIAPEGTQVQDKPLTAPEPAGFTLCKVWAVSASTPPTLH